MAAIRDSKMNQGSLRLFHAEKYVDLCLFAILLTANHDFYLQKDFDDEMATPICVCLAACMIEDLALPCLPDELTERSAQF